MNQRKYIQYLNQSQGSTSVLIVILMIVLMAFGMAALTTSYAGYRLAQKNVEFSKAYYLLEEEANRVKYDFFKIVVDENQKLHNNNTFTDEDSYYENMIKNVNTSILDYLKTHQDNMNSCSFETDVYDSSQTKGSRVRIGTVNYTISLNDITLKQLSVKLDIYAPEMENLASIKDTLHTLAWYEWQEGIGEVSEDLFFDDPFTEPSEEQFDDPFENPFEEPSESNIEG